MTFHNLAFMDLNPIHIGIVLLIALLLFGPQKLPEVGKQLGNALRDLKKAGSDVMNSLNADHDPEPTPTPTYDYSYPQPYDQSVPYGSYTSTTETPVDLTDYTIVGMPVKDAATNGNDPAAGYQYGYQNPADAYPSVIASSAEKVQSVHGDPASPDTGQARPEEMQHA